MAAKKCKECKGGGFGYCHNVPVRCVHHKDYDGKSKVRRNCAGCHMVYRIRHPICDSCWGCGKVNA